MSNHLQRGDLNCLLSIASADTLRSIIRDCTAIMDTMPRAEWKERIPGVAAIRSYALSTLQDDEKDS